MISLSFILGRVITFYGYLILAWVVLSWFPVREGILADVARVIGSIVEPYVGIFRRFIPVATVGGAGLDFSPIVAWLVLRVVGGIVVAALASAGL